MMRLCSGFLIALVGVGATTAFHHHHHIEALVMSVVCAGLLYVGFVERQQSLE
jgi:hypothetical protein